MTSSARVSIRIDKSLLKRIHDFAESHGSLTSSAALKYLLAAGLESEESKNVRTGNKISTEREHKNR